MTLTLQRLAITVKIPNTHLAAEECVTQVPVRCSMRQGVQHA